MLLVVQRFAGFGGLNSLVSSLLHLLGALFHLAHRQVFLDGLVIELELLFRVIEREQRPGVAHVHGVVTQTQLHLGGQFEQAQEVGDCGALLADALAQALLRQVILIDEFAQGERDFDGVQVLALDVLDERHLGDLAVIGGAHIGGHRVQACQQGGTIASFTRDDLIGIVTHAAQGEWLDDA